MLTLKFLHTACLSVSSELLELSQHPCWSGFLAEASFVPESHFLTLLRRTDGSRQTFSVFSTKTFLSTAGEMCLFGSSSDHEQDSDLIQVQTQAMDSWDVQQFYVNK